MLIKLPSMPSIRLHFVSLRVRTMQNIGLTCICFVFAALSMSFRAVDGVPLGNKQWAEWNTIGGGVKWLANCDFPGFDIRFEHIPVELCAKTCIDSSGCNAFSWNDGWCYLKNIPATSLRRVPSPRGSCGFLPWEFSTSGFIS
ncbi:hypothetical protein DAPPUDRAFT_303454 [Daphnia pulex]|uniref:Apple domain-containing protein n=1 Tax=Daphnia pulex TaxID=6669 RepID=E9GG66_DAPPU|nr:hypothetical protein DAPPUDRAFT_303454 [Daphnia pulex]|eukprot:EFX81344.1 hypothetical protein DAPPUDRAFT_303454 [Daphnia pulex]